MCIACVSIGCNLNPKQSFTPLLSIHETMSENQTADFKIAYDGTWYHDGAPIKREALAKLFSDRALKIDKDGKYWLQTPYEKYPVEVEDVPYVIVDYNQK